MGAAIPAGVPSPARRAPRDRRRPPNAAVEKRPTLRRRDPAPTAALAARHAHGRTTLGLRDRPTTRFSSAAGRFAGARRATARDSVIKNAQVVGRASGVCCERGWAAGLAAGRRAGAHRTCGRGRGDTGRRTESCPPRPTRPTAPAQRSLQKRPTLRRRDPAHTRRRWRRSTRMAGPRYGLRDRPTTRFSSAAGSRDRPRRVTARDGMVKNAQVWGRASGVCCERGWAATWAAGRRAGAHRTCARGRGDTGRHSRVLPAAPHATDGARPTQRSRAPHATAARSGPHAAVLRGMPRAWPDHAGAEGPPNASLQARRWQLC